MEPSEDVEKSNIVEIDMSKEDQIEDKDVDRYKATIKKMRNLVMKQTITKETFTNFKNSVTAPIQYSQAIGNKKDIINTLSI